jgi:tRNA 2-selenouridine synthase SelU
LQEYQIAHRIIEIFSIIGTSSGRTFLENQLKTSTKLPGNREFGS